MEKYQFKPFDQVLVRDENTEKWYPAHYKYYNPTGEYPHICDEMGWKQCIPYNEETAHLVGTAKPYTPPQPKTYQVVFIAQNGDRHQVSYTDDEFKKFIETAVLNNKDVSNFDVRRICG